MHIGKREESTITLQQAMSNEQQATLRPQQWYRAQRLKSSVDILLLLLMLLCGGSLMDIFLNSLGVGAEEIDEGQCVSVTRACHLLM